MIPADLALLDPRLHNAILAIQATYLHQANIPEADDVSDNHDKTCAICCRRFFLPVEFSSCTHAFCAECPWRSMSGANGVCCSLCRTRHFQPHYSEVNDVILSERSTWEKCRICLVILYLKLQETDGAMVSLSLDKAEYRVDFVDDLRRSPPGEAGLDDERLAMVEELE